MKKQTFIALLILVVCTTAQASVSEYYTLALDKVSVNSDASPGENPTKDFWLFDSNAPTSRLEIFCGSDNIHGYMTAAKGDKIHTFVRFEKCIETLLRITQRMKRKKSGDTNRVNTFDIEPLKIRFSPESEDISLEY